MKSAEHSSWHKASAESRKAVIKCLLYARHCGYRLEVNQWQGLPSRVAAWKERHRRQRDQYCAENCPRSVGAHRGPSSPAPGSVGEEAPGSDTTWVCGGGGPGSDTSCNPSTFRKTVSEPLAHAAGGVPLGRRDVRGK